MITISIIITALGLIIAAVGVAFFRHFSGLKTEQSFEDATEERKKLKENMNTEFEKTLVEMEQHKDSLNKKIEDETTEIISQLKDKSLEAKQALDNLKEQSNKATKEISTEVTKLKETTEKELEKLSFPLPSSFSSSSLTFIIKTEGLEKYLAEIREKFKTDSLLEERYQKGEYWKQSFPLLRDEINSELIDIFDEKEIFVSMQIGDANGPFSNENRNLIWTFTSKISFTDEPTNLLYYLDYKKEPKEYFKLTLGGNAKRIDSNGKLRLFSGLKSALELCGKTVHLSFQIGDNQILFPPIASIKHISFRDNNSKDYRIDFKGITTIRHSNEEFIKSAPDLNIPSYHETKLLTGKIKCLSF